MFRMRSVRRLVVAMAIVSATTTVMAVPSAAEVDESVLETAIEERGWFGLPNDEEHVRALLQGELDAVPGWPGLAVTAREATDLDFPARERFTVQVAERLDDYLSNLETLGGAWFDQTDGGRFVVSLTDDDPSVREAILDRLPADSLGVRFRDARYTLRNLREALPGVDGVWKDVVADSEPVAFGLDQSRNTIVIGVRAADWEKVTERVAEELAARLGVAVRFEIQKEGGDLACGDRNACANMQAGVLVHYNSANNGKLCSSGFIIKKASANPPYQFLTSGHCARILVSGTTYAWASNLDWWHNSAKVGDYMSHDLYEPNGIDVGRIGIDGGFQAITEQIFNEPLPYAFVPELGTTQGQLLCTSLAQTDDTTASDGMKCGLVQDTDAFWTSESGPWRVYGTAMNLSGSSGPIDGDSGSPIYIRSNGDAGNRRIPVGIVDHEFIPCGSANPGTPHGGTNHCGRDLYFAEIKEVLQQWSTWSIWTGQ